MRIKSSKYLKRNFFKNLSHNSDTSIKGQKKIFKIRERFLNSNTLSLLSNNFKMKTNKINITPILSQNSQEEYIKALNFKKYLDLLYKQRATTNQKQKFIEEYKSKDKPKISLYLFKNNFKFKRKKSKIFLNETPNNAKKINDYNDHSNVLINQLIKFNSETKIKKEKDLIPMKLGKEYQDFIEKKNKLNFNPNFNSPFIHRVNSCYMINKFLSRKKKYKINPTKLIINNDENESEENLEVELKDQMEDFSVDLEKYKKTLKQFFKDSVKLNQLYFHEKFFDNFANRINFIFDDRKFPTIKNKLNRIIVDIKNIELCEWKLLNIIENSTMTYLHKLKAKIQRELDEVKEKGKNKNKDKNFIINQQINRDDINDKIIKEAKNIKENSEDINKIFEFVNNKLEEELGNEDDYIESKKERYFYEKFFSHQETEYKTIEFASFKLTNLIYNNTNFYEKCYSNGKSKGKGRKLINNLREINLYL